MTEEVKPEKIKKTQESLSKYIKKPPLTEKLLKKPPFRFLHDIVTSVMRETGLLEGVFSQDELNSDNIKDRDGKISFLEKLISNIKSVTGTQVAAKPSKIIAGLEVNKTLDLLQALAKAVDIKVNGTKPSDKQSSSKPKDVKDSKRPLRNKEEKNDVSKKKRDEPASRGKEKDLRKKVETKGKIDKKKPEVNKTEKIPQKNEKLNNEVNGDTQLLGDLNVENTPTENGVGEKVPIQNGESPIKRQPSHKERPPSGDRISSTISSNERKSSADRRPPSDSVLPSSVDNQPVLDRKSSPIEKNVASDSALSEEKPPSAAESRTRLPNKVSLEQVVQVSNDSVNNSNLSDPSEKLVNGNNSPENNGELSSLETTEKPEKKVRVSSVNNRMERFLSMKNEENKQLEKLSENEKPENAEVLKSAKAKRPQSAKMKPGSSRQRRPVDDKSQGIEDKIGQVVLGQGDSTDVMGSAPIVAPSAKGRRMLSGRPMSTRPGAPKPKDRGQVNTSGGPSTSAEEAKSITLIEDKKEVDEEDIENLVIVEKDTVKTDEDKTMETETDLLLDESNQGALVAQILETKKELEDTKKGQWQSPYQKPNIEIDWEAKWRTKRDALAKEVESLRESIQTVTRSSNPLGKLFDFLQEDVELMQTELQEWTNVNTQLQVDIQQQNKQTEELLYPLRKQLSDLDLLIEHEQESIRRVKSNIYLNNSKLDNLLKINFT